jgi:hypothetical protein
MRKLDAIDETILKIMDKLAGCKSQGVEPPELKDDSEMDDLLENLLDAFGCTAK